MRRPAVPRAPLALLLAALAVVALNLRAPLTSVGPLIDDLRADLGLSGAAVGLLTTIPLITLGAVAPLAPRLARRCGPERVIVAALLAIAVGVAARRLPLLAPLLLGTFVAGCGIAIATVLVAAIVKQRFHRHAAVVMGLYSVTLSSGAALAAGLAVPLRDWLGAWELALAAWALPPLLAALLWTTQLRGAGRPAAPDAGRSAPPRPARARLWRDRLAWKVTVLMGIQSLFFYTLVAWLPAIHREHGADAATAGVLLSTMMLVGIPAGLATSVLASRLGDQRPIALVCAGVTAAGLVLLLVAPAFASPLPDVLAGVGIGGCFALSLTLTVLRAPDATHAAELAAMAQAAGYLLAAAGPFLFGAMHDMTGAWDLPLATLLVLTPPLAIAALGASRAGFVGDGRPAPPRGAGAEG